jgi:heme a synthase
LYPPRAEILSCICLRVPHVDGFGAGAFVAGLDAGRAYNTFPLMNGQLIPAEYFNPATPGLRNAFENTAAVQLHHRALALSTLAAISTFWVSTRGLPLPPPVKLLTNVLLAAAVTQVLNCCLLPCGTDC